MSLAVTGLRCAGVAMAALWLAACASPAPTPSSAPAPPAGWQRGEIVSNADPARADLAGHEVEVTRVYEHEVKTASGSQWQRVEYGWDYTEAVAYELITDLDGQRLSFRQVPGQIMRATEREQQRAAELVRRHPQLAATASTPGVTLHSGFILMQHDHVVCHLRSRCVYVLGTTDGGNSKILQAIVDLQSVRVVDPDFDPSMTRQQ